MKSIRLAPIALCALVLLVGAASAASRKQEILGTWRGTSTCVKSPEFPACHDEVVVYEVRDAAAGGDVVTLAAFKIVDGEKQLMGELDFAWDAKEGAWTSELKTPRVHGLWTFFVRGDDITGTLIDLPSKHRIRDVSVKKDHP